MTIPPSQSKGREFDYSSQTEDYVARSAFLLALSANAAKDQDRLIRQYWLTRAALEVEEWIFAAVSNLFGWLSKASIYGDVATGRDIARLRGEVSESGNFQTTTPTVGIVPPLHTQERLEFAYRTISKAQPEVEHVKTKVERLTRTEVTHEGQRAFLEAAKERGAQKWVRRVTDGRACQFCKLRSGETFESFDVPVKIHPNCTCSAELILGDQT